MKLFQMKQNPERDTFTIPKSVQKSIPINKVYKDGIFQVSGKFSKTWRFFDVNYKVASPEKQMELFVAYCAFLNALPVNATAKITLFNRTLNQKEFSRALLMPFKADGLDQFRVEYNDLLADKAADSNNLIQEKYITISVEAKSLEDAKAFFNRVGTALTTSLSRMDSVVREINLSERLRLFHDLFRPGEEQEYRFDLTETMRRGHSFKDAIAPDCLTFQKSHYEMGDHFGRTLFLRDYASFIKDDMITELMDYPRNMMLSIDIVPIGMDEAIKMVDKVIMSVDSEMYEAAELDGANKFQQFIHIILPSIKTIVTLNVILSITGSLSAFDPPYVITKGGGGTATYFVLMDKIAHTNQQVGLASAMAVVLLLIIFAATILQKLFFKLVFRSSDADNEEYTRRKRLRRERRWKKEAV